MCAHTGFAKNTELIREYLFFSLFFCDHVLLNDQTCFNYLLFASCPMKECFLSQEDSSTRQQGPPSLISTNRGMWPLIGMSPIPPYSWDSLVVSLGGLKPPTFQLTAMRGVWGNPNQGLQASVGTDKAQWSLLSGTPIFLGEGTLCHWMPKQIKVIKLKFDHLIAHNCGRTVKQTSIPLLVQCSWQT